MSGGSIVLLGVVLGLMMAFDMGGPLNKVAYAFATTGLATAATQTGRTHGAEGDGRRHAGRHGAAAGTGAGHGDPAAASSARPRRRTARPPGRWAPSFITEGAIPFAAADPLRVIPSIMAGSALTGALAMGMGVTLRAPHGGIFVLFAVDNVLGFFIALIAGVLLAAGLVIGLKSMGGSDADIATV